MSCFWIYSLITWLCFTCVLGLSIELPYWDLYLFLEVTPSVNRWTECNQLAQHFPPHPMEQDALFAPNHSGNLPTSHLNLVRAWRKRSLRTFMDVLQATTQASVHHIFLIFRPTSDHFYGGGKGLEYVWPSSLEFICIWLIRLKQFSAPHKLAFSCQRKIVYV